ncbi:Ppx/GppA phosphatase family protein [Nigerium massiliense]|uniref:Ppx/GppA phosphatase family protein n=1 Tax=Nigerium massiliense TaxID=1522317 RepID=UPI0005913F5A|nr:Ppx/GppA phosphatase family protein [Nigerium massiliense]
MSETTTVAAIDCGTNSVRLLIARSDGDGAFTEVDRDLHLTRLGQGVDATRRFAPEALERTMAALDDFAARIRRAGASAVRMVATSAARDATNRDEFFAGVRERLGVDAEIISGDEEARLSFVGALSAAPDADVPALVMDIGGGSTELVLGSFAGGRPELLGAVSLDMGSVRLRERFLHSDPPTEAEIADATRFVDGLLDGSGIDFGAARTWFGVGGTATCLSAVVLGLETYDRSVVHGSVVSKDDLDAVTHRLLTSPVAQVLELPSMPPKRADVICAGALIASRVGARVATALSVSESDILDGLVLDLLARA